MKGNQKINNISGNMWAQEWNNIYDIVMPYKGKVSVDITPQLRAQVIYVYGTNISKFSYKA